MRSAGWLCANPITSLSLSFLVCQMEFKISALAEIERALTSSQQHQFKMHDFNKLCLT